MTSTIVIGGGIGGLVAALRARRNGNEVTLIEARNELGGLASALRIDGELHDGGPYILLDRVRLGWALKEVGVDLEAADIVEMDPAYRIVGDRPLTMYSDLDRTVDSIETAAPGSGHDYRRFVVQATKALDHLAPSFVAPHSLTHTVRSGAWRAALWALPSLAQVLKTRRLNGPAADAVRIWTYIAGGDPARAPGPLALFPALIHRDGAARPAGGVHHIVSMLEAALTSEGVEVIRSTPVRRIVHDTTGVKGVLTERGDLIEADQVISDIGGAASLLDLVDAVPPRSLRLRMAGPLQSPGVTAYLRVRGSVPADISFRVAGEPKRAVAFIASGASPDKAGPGRIIAPLSHAEAGELGVDGQRHLLDEFMAADWWRDGVVQVDVAATRLVGDWGREFRLRDGAMNLTMARRQLLLGRLPHKIDHIPGLFLTGSWTHPGQWISFCAVSGVLAADAADGARNR